MADEKKFEQTLENPNHVTGIADELSDVDLDWKTRSFRKRRPRGNVHD